MIDWLLKSIPGASFTPSTTVRKSPTVKGNKGKSVTLSEVQELFNNVLYSKAMNYFGGVLRTDANPETALQIPAVIACINRISGTISTTPPKLYKRSAGTKQLMEDDIMTYKLAEEPNELMSASDFFHAMELSRLNRGYAFADIQYNSYGIPFLYPLPVLRVLTFNDGGRIKYQLFLNSGKVIFRYEEEVIHMRFITRDGITSEDPVELLRSTLMNALQMRLHSVSFFKNYANPSLILKHPGAIGEDALKHLRESVIEKHEGAENSGKAIILEEGMTADKLTDSFINSQFEQMVRFLNGEIARFYGVQPHKIAIMDQATFSNIESQSAEYLTDTVLPIAVRYEQEFKRKLLVTSPRYGRQYFVKFDMDEIKRAEMDKRFTAYSQGIQWGIFSPNEVRNKENMNARDGGDVFLRPLNMTDGSAPIAPASTTTDDPAPDDSPDDGDEPDGDEPSTPAKK